MNIKYHDQEEGGKRGALENFQRESILPAEYSDFYKYPNQQCQYSNTDTDANTV